MSIRKRSDELAEQASQALFHAYVKSPKIIKRFTKPLVKTAVRTQRKVKPYTENSLVKANVWIDTNIKGNKVVRIATAMKNNLIPKKKKT